MPTWGGLPGRKASTMAWYQDQTRLSRIANAVFDEEHGPGEKVPHSGIYRCKGCNKEIAANVSDPFPPQNHHQHSISQGSVRWQLLVWTQY